MFRSILRRRRLHLFLRGSNRSIPLEVEAMSGFRPRKETLDRVLRCLLLLGERKKKASLPVSHASYTPACSLSIACFLFAFRFKV